jgi:hypothetical protein
VLVFHSKLVTEFFLELGTTFDLIARNIVPYGCGSSEEKETDNDGYSHRGPALTKIRRFRRSKKNMFFV